jgi:ABC-2 type transport system permease protein
MLAIIKNEWRNLLRSRMAIVLLLVLLLLAIFTVWQSFSTFKTVYNARAAATAHMREKFTGQGEVNPHSAAHYGHYVYKPVSTLSVLDEGLTPYTGVTLRLEGHRQNEAVFSPVQESSSLVRFGQLNLSLVLQVLLPLFMLFICHNAISGEKENGNLPVSLIQGNSLRKLVWGKVMAYTIIWVGFLTITLGFLWALTGTHVTGSQWERLLATWLVYSVYYFIITALAVFISAKSKTSANALLTVLFAWLICTVLLPKATANMGENMTPLITRIEMDKQINEENKNGIDGHNPKNERTKKFMDSLVTTYKVDSVSQVPVNLDGLTMQADEEYHNVVYDKHFGELAQSIQKQNKATTYSSFINPYAAVSNISMSLSGTDIFHHFHFTKSAEEYRRVIIKAMNDEQAYGGSKTGDWDWTTKADFWEKIKDFDYQQPSAQWSLQHHAWELAALFGWLLLVLALIHFNTNNINILK